MVIFKRVLIPYQAFRVLTDLMWCLKTFAPSVAILLLFNVERIS